MNHSDLERAFALAWTALGPSAWLEPEYRFHPTRRWRFDFAHRPTRVAVELEGGVWTGGRHNRAGGFIADCEKYNEAAARGWLVIRLPGALLADDPDRAVGWVARAIQLRQRCRHPGWRRERWRRRALRRLTR